MGLIIDAYAVKTTVNDTDNNISRALACITPTYHSPSVPEARERTSALSLYIFEYRRGVKLTMARNCQRQFPRREMPDGEPLCGRYVARGLAKRNRYDQQK